MAGPFAHLMTVDRIVRTTPDLLDEYGAKVRYVLEKHTNFCQLGAVSPDLPSIDFLHPGSRYWANIMHYWNTADVLRKGVAWFAGRDLSDPNDQKALAWLFGYAAHVVTDLTVHPVLAASGFPYAEQPFEHRMCEVNQDAYIFRELNGTDPETVGFIENCGIGSCCDPSDDGRVFPAVRALWLHCLADIDLAQVQMKEGAITPNVPPTPDAWFSTYTTREAEFLEHHGGFILYLRGLVDSEAISLPPIDHVNVDKYIKNLKTSSLNPTDYDTVFASAVDNVRRTWRELSASFEAHDQTLFTLNNADMDTGIVDGTETQVFPA